MNEKNRLANKLIAEAAVSACHNYIDLIFRNESYEDLSIQEKLRVNSALIKTNKLAAKFQA